MTFTIRTASLADVAAMHAVRLAVRENRLSDRRRVTAASYRRYVAAGTSWVAATANHDLLGFAALDRGKASVWALFVHPDHEGIGVGRALHDTMLGWARRHGIGALSLVTASGTRAERFYLGAGWSKRDATGPAETRFEKLLV